MDTEKTTIAARLNEKEWQVVSTLKEKHNFETDTQLIKFLLYRESDLSVLDIINEIPDWESFTSKELNRKDESKRNKVIFAYIFELMAQIKQLYDKLYPDATELPKILSEVPEAIRDLQKRAGRHELDGLPIKPDKSTSPFTYVDTGAELYHILHGKIKVTRDGDFLMYKKEAFNLDGVPLNSDTFIPVLFWEKPSIELSKLPPPPAPQKDHTVWMNIYTNKAYTLHSTEEEADNAPDIISRINKVKLYGRG